MTKKIFFIAIILISILDSITGQTSKYLNCRFTNPIIKSEFLLYLSKNYCYNANSILNKRPYEFYSKWIKGKYHYEILSSFATVVHETCHEVNSDIGGIFSYGYFVSPTIEIKVSISNVFKSNELDKTIPESWKCKIFRYKTYIQGINEENELTSICDGIYGLMDEFDAYYQSTRAVVELYGYYKTIGSYIEPYYWTLYISNCYSSILAYYEFKVFIAWYLKFAKNNYPKIYYSLIQNNNLKVVYTLIESGYKKVVDQYFKNRDIIEEQINKAGIKKAETTSKYFLIKTKTEKGYTVSGYGIPDSEIAFLNSIVTVDDIQILNTLTIKNLNENNFKTFIK